MGNSQYHWQHYITYHGYKYSLPSVAGFIRQSGDYYYFLRRKYPAGKAAKGLTTLLAVNIRLTIKVGVRRRRSFSES